MWYAKKSASSGQGIVIDEQTGQSVAVAYDTKDTALLAAAPELLAALQLFTEFRAGLGKTGAKVSIADVEKAARAAIAKATGNG